MRFKLSSSLQPQHSFECNPALPFVGALSSGKEFTDVPFLKLISQTLLIFTLKK
jgi:hypothetical protein